METLRPGGSGEEGGGAEDDPSRSLPLPKSSSFSPKVTRPKLPPFAGSGSRSASPRSKTDPGRVEIKSIMEDIMNLNKTDWKTFSRSRKSSKPKSVSTNTSPTASPRIGSPVAEEGNRSCLQRDRSRSLKLLTDRLKHKNSKPPPVPHDLPSPGPSASPSSSSPFPGPDENKDVVVVSRNFELQSSGNKCEQWLPPPAVHGPVPRRSPERRSVERTTTTYEQIPESPEDMEQEEEDEAQGTKSSSEESFRSAPEVQQQYDDVSGGFLHERSPDSGDFDSPGSVAWEKTPDRDMGSRSQELEHRPHERTPSKPMLVTEDEGLGEGGDPHASPVVSTYIYHPIPRNSKFLQLAATKPPKRFPPERRSGITMLATRGRVGAMGKTQGGGEEHRDEGSSDAPKQRFQRRSDSGKSSLTKSSPRFITHPPHAKASNKEAGTLDTNGFAALKSTSGSGDGGAGGAGVGEEEEEEEVASRHPSQMSLADSQFASEASEDASYQDVVESVVSTDSSGSDVADRKNGKSTKQKSKSDPSGDRARDILDFPQSLESLQSQSTPLLSKEELEAMGFADKSLLITEEEATKQKSRSDTLLSSHSNDRSCSEEDDDDAEFKLCETTMPEPHLSPPPRPGSASKHSGSPTPGSHHGLPPAHTMERPTTLLSVPGGGGGGGRKPNIFRSASSASVLQSRKPVGSPLREKDVIHKFSITSDESPISNAKSSVNLVPDFLPIGDTSASTAASMPAVWNKERLFSSADSPEREPGFIKDQRYHIVEELYKNEKEYVDALRTLKDKYMAPLKTQSSVDDALVDDIFYMIPEILTHHSIYLNFLDSVWKHWDTQRSTVGNIITKTFAKQTVLDSYKSFVENYRASGKVIENALTTKSSVQKFIEQCQKDSGSKLTMKDLIVRPIQRIPRYELLIQRLLDNTSSDHPDQPLLREACRVMHDLAVQIGTVNDSQHLEDIQETLKKLELLLITDLAVPDRAYIRHDMVQLFNKKDQCCIWLFSDVILLSSIKRKSGPVPRKVSIILKSPLGQDFAENIKHKVWLRVGLDDLEIVKTQGPLTRKPTLDKEQVEEDLALVTQLTELAGKLTCQHQSLEDQLKELHSTLSRQLSEANARSAACDSNKMELLVTTQEGVLHLVIGFPSSEKRGSWESAFTEAKQKLSLLSDKRAPEFLQPLQITKTRAGMQFSCAAPIDGLNSSGFRDVWVCNSDGYVGHMCLLSLQPEPIVTLNTPVPGCNARILCICAVPAFNGAFRRRASQKGARSSQWDPMAVVIPEKKAKISAKTSITSTTAGGEEEDTARGDKTDDTEEAGVESGDVRLRSPPASSPIPPSSEDLVAAGDHLMEEEGYQSDSDSSDDDDAPVSFITRPDELYVGEILPEESSNAADKAKVSELTESSPDPITTSGSWDQDPVKSTMWLGTEDGCIHIFQSCDNIKTTKNKLKIQHGSPVYCIIYLDNKVFVSLVNGDLIVYKRDQDGLWDTEHPYTRTIGSASAPITKMMAVAGKLWCGCQNQIHVINPLALNIETSFQVSSDPSRSVQCLVSSGQGVWVASQSSSKVALFHAVTYEFLMEVSIAQAVSQKLQSADDIIRQHKAACLRITALMVCKDLLWVGTSAGVVLTLPIPRITITTTRGSLAMPAVTGLVYGHTGHVRFLTSVELSGTSSTPGPMTKSSESSSTTTSSTTTTTTSSSSSRSDDNTSTDRAAGSSGGGFTFQDIHRRSSMAASTATMASRMLVISGGDGYEDFRNSASNEGAGRDDSTNHLLLWQV